MLVVVAVAFHPLWSHAGILNDDYPAVYLRIHQYFQEFRYGHLPAVLPDVVRGGGSAFPRFYPPFAYYLGAASYALVGDMVVAGHLTALLSLLLSAAAMVWAARRLGVPPGLAVVAGLAYATFPYRFTNVLVRGALAESWALVWLPLIFVSAVRVGQDARAGLALAATSALLFTTHTGLALWALPAIVGAAVAACPKGRLASTSVGMVVWVLAGVGLAAWYLLPMWYYLPTVRASDPEVMFTTAKEFSRWRVDWGQAFGFGRLLTNPQTALPLAVPMTFSIGLSSLVLVPALALVAPANRGCSSRGIWCRAEHGATMAAVALLLVAMYPKLVAGWVPRPLLYLQFPYRLMGVVAMLVTIATALALGRLLATRTGTLLLAIWAGIVGGTILHETRQPTPSGQLDHGALLALLPSRDKGLTARYEYLPRTDEPEAIGPRVQATRDSLRSRAVHLRDTTNRLEVTLYVMQPTQVVLPRVAYDFFRVEDQAGRELPVSSVGGLLAVDLPAGSHTFSVERRTTWPTRLGIGVSLLTVALLGLLGRRRAPVSGVPG